MSSPTYLARPRDLSGVFLFSEAGDRRQEAGGRSQESGGRRVVN
ncbi:hypothetical protein [Pannus brasiliensis]